MSLNAQDADQVILDATAKVKDFMDEFRKKWSAPYTALAEKQQQQAVKGAIRDAYEKNTTPQIRAQMVAQLGEAKVAAFEKLLEVNNAPSE